MKFLIFSDSHGERRAMESAIEANLSDLAGIFFLGDGLRDIEALSNFYPQIPVAAVAGNCDHFFVSENEEDFERLVEAGGKKILIAHGHRLGVKGSLTRAADHAIAHGADLFLFGHTHRPTEIYLPPEEGREKGLYLFNPGSASFSSDGTASFGVLELRGNDLLLSHGKVERR